MYVEALDEPDNLSHTQVQVVNADSYAGQDPGLVALRNLGGVLGGILSQQKISLMMVFDNLLIHLQGVPKTSKSW